MQENTQFVDYTNTNPIDTTYYRHDNNTYAILEKKDISKSIDNHAYIRGIPLYIDGMIYNITIVNPPQSQYTLLLNGHNCMTAQYDGHNYIFDFRNHKSELLQSIIDTHISNNEPPIEDRNNFINLSKIDSVMISFPPEMISPEYNSNYNIMITGYFNDNNEWKYMTKIFNVYPNYENNIRLNINHPTDSIDIEFEQVSDSKIGKVIFYVQYHEYERFDIDFNNSAFKRIKFADERGRFVGRQNKYLSDFINKNTINFNMVDSIRMTVINCKVRRIYQNAYRIYNYPNRMPLFLE
jgi:hypothetical protein